MSEKPVQNEDGRLTFSDEDFERRYLPEKAASAVSGAGHPSPIATAQAQPLSAGTGRSRNRFMRTLIRRRLASHGTA
jgi:hypothetical protein